MEVKEEKLEESRGVEVGMDRLMAAAKKRAERGGYEKAPALDMPDVGAVASIKKVFEFPSKFDDGGVYYSALLDLSRGGEALGERWKSLNGWDMEAIATGAKRFRVSTVKHKGAFKLVLVADGGGAKPPPSSLEGYV